MIFCQQCGKLDTFKEVNMKEKIFVTKPFLPPKEEFFRQIDDIYESNVLTNQGPKVRELESRLSDYLGVSNFHFVTNGTIALQLALKTLGITEGEVITTPFSYVATVSSVLWERCTPVFVDIEPDNFTIDVTKIEAAITPQTKAIMPVHVFGYACDVEAIDIIAAKHGLKVIYDAAHAFAARYKGKSLCSYGDISTLSFHATKLYHTGEGGACIVGDKAFSDKLELIKRFGHNVDEYVCLGINGKKDEFCAAMGLVNLAHMEKILAERKLLAERYDRLLNGRLGGPKKQEHLEYNYAYYPVIFESEQVLLSMLNQLASIGVYPRRYFYPSLNRLPYLKKIYDCPISEDIASRIACLPFYPGIENAVQEQICEVITGDSGKY